MQCTNTAVDGIDYGVQIFGQSCFILIDAPCFCAAILAKLYQHSALVCAVGAAESLAITLQQLIGKKRQYMLYSDVAFVAHFCKTELTISCVIMICVLIEFISSELVVQHTVVADTFTVVMPENYVVAIIELCVVVAVARS